QRFCCIDHQKFAIRRSLNVSSPTPYRRSLPDFLRIAIGKTSDHVAIVSERVTLRNRNSNVQRYVTQRGRIPLGNRRNLGPQGSGDRQFERETVEAATERQEEIKLELLQIRRNDRGSSRSGD